MTTPFLNIYKTVQACTIDFQNATDTSSMTVSVTDHVCLFLHGVSRKEADANIRDYKTMGAVLLSLSSLWPWGLGHGPPPAEGNCR